MRSAFLGWQPESDINHKVSLASDTPALFTNPVSGITADQSCNEAVTVKCLQQLYNAVGHVPKIPEEQNRIGVTAFLEPYVNIEDLTTFYKDQVPQTVGSSFEFISVNGEREPKFTTQSWSLIFGSGGQNSQNLSESGIEAAIDVQLVMGWCTPFLVFTGPRVALPLPPIHP